MALLSGHVVALCGQAGGGEGGKVHSLFWWKKCVETLIDHLEEWSPIKSTIYFFLVANIEALRYFPPIHLQMCFYSFKMSFCISYCGKMVKLNK